MRRQRSTSLVRWASSVSSVRTDKVIPVQSQANHSVITSGSIVGAIRHSAVQVSIDGVRLGIDLSQIAGVHREKCLLLRLGEPRLGPDRCGYCVDLTPGLGGPCLTPSGREDAEQVREYPVRFTDIDLFGHMNNAVYWSVVEDYPSTRPELLGSPLRVTVEHEAPIALGDKLEILAHTHPAGSTDRFGPELADRAVRTLTYVAGDQTKAIASLVAPLAARTDRAHTDRACRCKHSREGSSR
jgi:hypothetical protein